MSGTGDHVSAAASASLGSAGARRKGREGPRRCEEVDPPIADMVRSGVWSMDTWVERAYIELSQSLRSPVRPELKFGTGADVRPLDYHHAGSHFGSHPTEVTR